MKKILPLLLSLILTLTACSASEKNFTFESEAENGEKLTLSFAASPLEGNPSVYISDVTSTKITITNEEGRTYDDVLRTPVSGQGSFSYYSEYDIPIKLIDCGEGVNTGLVGIPDDNGIYHTTIYVYRDEIFTIITDLFPEVKAIDDITLEGNIISFYDGSEEKNVSYRIDFERFTAKRV